MFVISGAKSTFAIEKSVTVQGLKPPAPLLLKNWMQSRPDFCLSANGHFAVFA
jgi:hypothetical protein